MSRVDRSASPPVRPAAGARLPTVHAWRDGGRRSSLECLAREVPLFHLSVLLDRGLLAEPQDSAGHWGLGVAALTEGTESYPGSSFMRRVEELGGELSAGIGWESTAVQVAGHLDQCDELLELLGEVVTAPEFSPEAVARLRQERLASLQRLRHHAGALADATLVSRLLPGRAGLPGAGLPKTLASVDRAAARSSWDRIRGATRVGWIWSSGEELAAKRRAAILSSLGWAGNDGAIGGDREAVRCVEREAAILVVDRPGASQVELRIGQAAPPRGAGDRSARRLMNAILGGQFTSRLNLRLRERDAATYGVSSAFVERREHGLFRVAAAVETEKIDLAVRGVLEEVERLRSEPPTAAELEDARSYLMGVQPFRLQTLHGVSGQLQLQWLHGLPVDAFAEETADLSRPDRAAVQREAFGVWDPEKFQIVAVGPAEALRSRLSPIAAEACCEVIEVASQEVFGGPL